MIIVILALAVFCGATILLEAIPCLVVREKRAWWKASVICNMVTNPILNVLLLLLVSMSFPEGVIKTTLMLLELVVVLVEAHFYKRMLNKKFLWCFLFSVVANLISFGVGMLLNSMLV